MSEYIRKCLLVYVSMAIILCGMVGVTYAITATDADQYVTRSQYAVDMAHLQNKLDEQEAGLMGNINRFRSTDVKFVTWDTPKNYATSGAYIDGYHNGGNFFPRQRTGIATNFLYPWGLINGSEIEKRQPRNADFQIYRLWNGNYHITRSLHYVVEGSTNMPYQTTVNYAVPIENYPGWYLEVRMRGHGQRNSVLVSAVKLDPTSTTPRPTASTEPIVMRFKKGLFKYAWGPYESSKPLTTTKKVVNYTADYWYNKTYNGTFSYIYCNNTIESRSSTVALTLTSWIDESTGDYMLTIGGMYSTGMNGSDPWIYNYMLQEPECSVCYLIPSDNVEYISGNISSNYIFSYPGKVDGNFGIPCGAIIGTGLYHDPYWQYEFVDCENGIKYWHAYRAPRDTAIPGANGVPLPYGIHYQLPIVY